mmetsp:Transcript_25142/g.22859  ORF Transcript_25142/g.22859 Transcript_25142/m.22859 type:complete len:183 (+) Transcript_25142:249-797(+)
MFFKDVVHKFIIISVATVLLIIAYSGFGYYYKEKIIKSTDETQSDIYSSCKCDFTGLRIKPYDCSDLSYPVLGGVDLVDYFTTFKLSSGVYNDSLIGSYGNQNYSYVYNSYTFYFRTVDNKELFILSPESYLPQYGGFCAKGIANEFCPRYPWSSNCLGPYGNWGKYLIICTIIINFHVLFV